MATDEWRLTGDELKMDGMNERINGAVARCGSLSLPLLHGPWMHHPPAPRVWRRMTREGTRGTDYAFHITFTAKLVAASGRSSAHAHVHARRHPAAAVTTGAAVVVTNAAATVRRRRRRLRGHGGGQRLLLRRLHGVRLGMHWDTIT